MFDDKDQKTSVQNILAFALTSFFAILLALSLLSLVFYPIITIDYLINYPAAKNFHPLPFEAPILNLIVQFVSFFGVIIYAHANLPSKIFSYFLALWVFVGTFISVPFGFAALFYAMQNFENIQCVNNARDFTDFLYFSYSAFSTMIFGDFTPTPSCRLYAAVESILGITIFSLAPIALIVSALFGRSKSSLTQAPRLSSKENRKRSRYFNPMKVRLLNGNKRSRLRRSNRLRRLNNSEK